MENGINPVDAKKFWALTFKLAVGRHVSIDPRLAIFEIGHETIGQHMTNLHVHGARLERIQNGLPALKPTPLAKPTTCGRKNISQGVITTVVEVRYQHQQALRQLHHLLGRDSLESHGDQV
jgi:hypothetical protein